MLVLYPNGKSTDDTLLHDVGVFPTFMHDTTGEMGSYLTNCSNREGSYYAFLKCHDKSFPTIPHLKKPKTKVP